MRITKQEKQEALDNLRKWLKPGDTIYCVMRHKSRSGMYRAIDLYTLENGEPFRLSGYASKLLEGYDNRHEACRASGCGMDMGFHLVSNLGYALYPEGFECVGQKCPSNDHSNGDRNHEVHHHESGGYAFFQRWM